MSLTGSTWPRVTAFIIALSATSAAVATPAGAPPLHAAVRAAHALGAHPGGLYTKSQIDFVVAQVHSGQQPWAAADEQLMAAANRLRSWQPHTTAFYVTPGYYKGAAAFFAATNGITHDADAAYVNAVAYRLTGDASYADCTVRILRAWAHDNTGVATTDDSQLSMAELGTGFIESAELLTGYAGWSDADRTSFRNWIHTVYLKQSADPIKDRTNNWGEWGTFGAVTADYYLDDAAGFAAETARLQQHIDQALSSDGHMPDEVSRGESGLWYTYFALAPMTAAARVIENGGGPNLFQWSSPSGKRIKVALDVLLAAVQDPHNWPAGVTPKGPNPTKDWWPYDLFEAMSDEYGNKQYDAYAAQRRPIMNTGHHHAWTFPTLLKISPNAT
jgi:hypothetical protein